MDSYGDFFGSFSLVRITLLSKTMEWKVNKILQSILANPVKVAEDPMHLRSHTFVWKKNLSIDFLQKFRLNFMTVYLALALPPHTLKTPSLKKDGP